MKNIKKLLLLTLIAFPISTNAASIGCSGGGTVTQGNTFTVRFSGSHSDTAMWNINGIYYNSSIVSNQTGFSHIALDQQSFSSSYTFKASNIGSTTIYLTGVDVADTGSTGNQLIGPGATSGACSVTVVAPQTGGSSNKTNSSSNGSSSKSETNANLSSNNNLASLSIDEAKISPEFSKDVYEYTAKVANDVEKITIHASALDDNASVYGYGEKELVEGFNEFNIVVTAENGADKTYKITVERVEKDPIKVKVNGVVYTVVKKELEEFKAPEGFELSSVKINGEEVVSYYNKSNNITLVVLQDKKGKTYLFMYDTKTKKYTKYLESNNTSKLALLDADKLNGFTLKTIKINGEDVKVLVNKYNDKFIVVKAIDLETGKEGYYIYNEDNKSFIAYNKEIYSPSLNINNMDGVINVLKKSGYMLYAAIIAGVVILLLLLSISFGAKNKSLKKRLKKLAKDSEGKTITEEGLFEEPKILEEKEEQLLEDIKEKEEEKEEIPEVMEETPIVEEEIKEEPPKPKRGRPKRKVEPDTEPIPKIEEAIEEVKDETRELTENIDADEILEEVADEIKETKEMNKVLDETMEIDEDFLDIKKPRRRRKKK